MLKVIVLFLLAVSSVDVTVIRTIDDCQLLIAGGSTAALGAILSASKFLDTRVCLLEPTDWIGGQLTAELLSAPDFAGHYVIDKDNFTLRVSSIDRDPINRTPLFTQMLNVLGDTGHCTVSPWCSIPQLFLEKVILPLVNHTRIFYNTVIKRVKKDPSGRRIIQVDAIQRTARSGEERCRFLSEELPDWYSPNDSAWFSKEQLSFTNFSLIIEGTSWGEVLVLSNASYLQGLMEQYDGDISGNGSSTCGQAITIDYLETLSETPMNEPPNPLPPPAGGGNYSLGGVTWEHIWVFRRVNTTVNGSKSVVAFNDTTIQNWYGGDDYVSEFFYLSSSETQQQRDTDQWQGGVNLDTILNAERRSYGTHYWFREQAPSQYANRTVLVRSPSMTGTCHHLAKLPYMRESRRSIGHQNFLMNLSAISGPGRSLHGYIFDDRMCIGCYDVDIHFMKSCSYPAYIFQYYPVLPYYIPLRAMTNRDIDNLMPIGKTMAQSFLVNAAVRLHPVEFSTGQAAGVAAAYAIQNNLQKVADMLDEEHLRRVQSLVKQFTPLSWTIDGKRYPDD